MSIRNAVMPEKTTKEIKEMMICLKYNSAGYI